MSSGSRRARAKAGRRLTELADTLVREHDLPFRTAHAIAAKVLKSQAENPQRRLASVLRGRVLADARTPLAVHEARTCSGS